MRNLVISVAVAAAATITGFEALAAGDGSLPASQLTVAGGYLYGTTESGGTYDLGTVFRITPAGDENVVYSLKAPSEEARSPGHLVHAFGSLYGTTGGGGHGFGTVYRVRPDGAKKNLYAFMGAGDGAYPSAGLTQAGGVFYGTTAYGGANGQGTVFSVTPAGIKTTLYSFAGGADGANPLARLTLVGNTLYGTTWHGGGTACGGLGCGTVFAITIAGAESIVYAFQGGADGSAPIGSVVYSNSKGLLFGTTSGGGSNGGGSIFQLTLQGVKTTLHAFSGIGDGATPQGDLIKVDHNLYGTTIAGGANSEGSVFEISETGDFRTLYSFQGGFDGASPYAGLIKFAGVLYGTTANGGGFGCGPFGCGTVFRITPGGSYAQLYRFKGS